MVRYFLTDRRGAPVYFSQRRLRRTNLRHNLHARNLSQQLQQIEERQQSTFVTTALVCMVRNRAWADVLKRCETHPQEMLTMDGATGNTVLHTACRLNPPAEIVQALAVTPALARQPNIEGATPLHVAASHRISAEALQALLDACRPKSTTTTPRNEDKENHQDGETVGADLNEAYNEQGDDYDYYDDDDKHTSPTADLSRMGRAPIHYACMSYRGLEIDAFCLLLDATLQEGNVWVYENSPSSEHDLFSNAAQSCCGLVNEESSDGGGDDDDDKFNCVFTDETDRDLYQQHTDDLTVDGDDDEKVRKEPVKVLVNVMGMKDATGQTPLGLLFRRYRERVRCVINTVDRLRSEQDSNPDRAALVAALRVHADLGELWEKARWIVARLTEERLQREEALARGDEPVPEALERDDAPPARPDATSRRATYLGPAASSLYDSTRFAEPPSPAEAAVAHEAASWAAEQHQVNMPPHDDMLPLAPNVSTIDVPAGVRRPRSRSPTGISGRQFRIVHASVGLTGYGCPPELIRLAISIHPHQVTEMDEDGNLPLHIAVTAASYLATASHATQDHPTMAEVAAAAAAASDNADDLSVISDAAMSFFSSATVSQTTNPFDKVIKILLQQYPEAARIPQGKTGRLPLVLAVESRRRTWADGIKTLLNAYPPALHNKKIIPAELYPHVLSLVANNGVQSSPCASFNFNGGIVDLLPVLGEAGGDDPQTNAGVQQQQKTRKRSKRAIRQEECSRSTLFDLLRTKPEYLTKYFDFDKEPCETAPVSQEQADALA